MHLFALHADCNPNPNLTLVTYSFRNSDLDIQVSPENFDYLDQSRIRSEQGRMYQQKFHSCLVSRIFHMFLSIFHMFNHMFTF